MKKRTFITCIFLTLYGGINSWGQDRLLNVLRSELEMEMAELKQKEFPPYYMNYRVVDKWVSYVSTSFGTVSGKNSSHQRVLVPQIRIGSADFDNFRSKIFGTDRISSAPLPIDEENCEDAVRQSIWQETNDRYRFAITTLRQEKSNRAIQPESKDKAPCFSGVPVEKYYEMPLPADRLSIDFAVWEQRLMEISSVFNDYAHLVTGEATLSYMVERRYFVDTEGTEVVQNLPYARIMINAMTKAEDGMELPLYLSYFAYDPKDLPANEVIVAEATTLAKKLSEIREAPVVDPYSGPALLSGAASGVFFHEIFGHRIEGLRLKSDSDGQTFKKMVGKYVLPEGLSVYDDPSLKEYNGEDLNGYYKYDDQGVKGQRVDVVVDGKLNDFLMTRTPIDNHPRSNGHARTDMKGTDPVSRQSNLVIETKNHKTDTELRTILVEEIKKQGKAYGFFFKEVTGGFTFTGSDQINSFNVTPLEVYKVYADNRPDELVRGVDIIGTPLSMFSNIIHAGGETQVFIGMCGAESGQVPVTAISPTILVNKIEVQRKAKSQNPLPILKRPIYHKRK